MEKSRRIRISKKLKSALPTNVAQAVEDLAESYNIKSLSLRSEPAGYQLRAGEGERIRILQGDLDADVEMIAAHNLGATGLSMKIGERTPPLPAGTWIIRVSYYTRYWMDLINIGQPALETA
jgi:hypothetical protein